MTAHVQHVDQVIGLSTNLNDMVSRYGKEVIVAEVGGDYTLPQNTYAMLVAVQSAVKAVPNSKGMAYFTGNRKEPKAGVVIS